MKYAFDSVAIAAVYMGENLFPTDREDLSAGFDVLRRYFLKDQNGFGIIEEGDVFEDNYKAGTLKNVMMLNFSGICDFSFAVSLYLDEIDTLDIPFENRTDYIRALARQYIAPAEIDIPDDQLDKLGSGLIKSTI